MDIHVRPFAGTIRADFILMEDDSGARRTRVTNLYLELAAIDWPSRSSDLSLMEHAWDMLQ